MTHDECFYAGCTNTPVVQTTFNGEPRPFCTSHKQAAEAYNQPTNDLQ